MRPSYEGLLKGSVDVAELLGPYARYASENPELRRLYDRAQEWCDLTGTQPMPHVLATYEDILERDPEMPKRLIQAFLTSQEYARQNLEPLIEEFVETFGGDTEKLRQQVEATPLGQRYAWTLTDDDRRTIRAVWDMGVELGYFRERPAVDEVVFPLG